MTRRELIELCLTFPGAWEDYPFDDDPGDPAAWTVMRHNENRKSFAFIFERDGLCINLKCEPLRAELLRKIYPCVTPAYHMNKTHWNTVRVNAGLPEQELSDMIAHSFELTRPKARAR